MLHSQKWLFCKTNKREINDPGQYTYIPVLLPHWSVTKLMKQNYHLIDHGTSDLHWKWWFERKTCETQRATSDFGY